MADILLNNYSKKVNDVNSSRQIAAKLSKQNALEEKNTSKMDTKKLGKKKDVDARKILKLSSNESYQGAISGAIHCKYFFVKFSHFLS